MNNSGMDPTLTDAQPKEQRILAAIIFTDVVGFSRLAAKNEARVYVALQRDMGIMTDLCRAHNGSVLNTMGDGMLMSFSSAVDAMACALEIQRTLASQASSLPASDVLHHRIGVHLGDVIEKGDNVFGDGVNTAARLQNDARPDSIWFSNTVHEVIKNKLKFQAKYIGKRQFKNLGEPVQVWEIPPIAEANAQRQAEAMGFGTATMQQQESEGASGGRAALLILASLVLVGAVVFMVTRIDSSAQAVKPKAGQTPTGPPPDVSVAATTGASVGETTPGGQDPARTITPQAAISRVEELKTRYAFGEIVQYLAGDGKAHPQAAILTESFGKLASMRQWMEEQIAMSTPADQILVTLPSGEAQIYNQQGTGPMMQLNHGGFQPMRLDGFAPADFSALARGLGSRPGRQAPPELEDWIGTFNQVYAVTT